MKISILPVGMYQENTYVIHQEGHTVIVDPGGHPEIISAYIDTQQKVEAIVLTHGHQDHVSAVDPLVKQYGCPVFLHPGDFDLVGKNSSEHAFSTPLKCTITPMGSVIDVPGFHFEVLETPGHTLGSVCLVCENVMFSGDTLFAGSIGRTDLADSDPNKMKDSLKRLLDMDGEYHVLPGHGPSTTLQKEKQTNPYLNGYYRF